MSKEKKIKFILTGGYFDRDDGVQYNDGDTIELTETESKRGIFRNKLRALSSLVSADSKAVATLKATVKAQQERISELEDTVKAQQERISELEDTVKAQQERISEREDGAPADTVEPKKEAKEYMDGSKS